ncbi:MAG: hypothetical protein RIQ81_1941 [Pseudomonadota bacterium]|jgi:putative ABC transport system ATP-binding protein
MKHMIEIENLRFDYGDGTPVLDVGSLDVAAGERIFVCGPSGCGKSTLLGLLTGILPSSPGTVRILGQDLALLRPHQRDAFRGAHMGYVFQSFNLLPYLSVAENIALPAGLSPERYERAGGSTQAHREKAAQLAGKLGIGPLLERPVTSLSFGQQQRVAAARALFGNPEILVCDEPTSALDHLHRDRFLDVLMEVTRECGTTVIFVSHDVGIARRFDRTIELAGINRAFRASTGDD